VALLYLHNTLVSIVFHLKHKNASAEHLLRALTAFAIFLLDIIVSLRQLGTIKPHLHLVLKSDLYPDRFSG